MPSREQSAKRELSKLVSTYLTDGVRGLDRTRNPDDDPTLPRRIHSLFHATGAAEQPAASLGVGGGRRLVQVHNTPPVYAIPNFLSPRELDHIDDLLTRRRAAFKLSHTDGSKGETLISEERTSISLPLPKSGDAVLRTIEARAAEIVGLPSDHVEPLQIVHYSHGARFDLHHDVAPIEVRASDDEAPPGESASPRRSERAHAAAEDDPRVLRLSQVRIDPVEGPRRLVTFFVYCNTLPEGVGHTEFPLLVDAAGRPFSMRPRCGTALLFCNVTAGGEPDGRLCHRACPVGDGQQKFGINIWVSDVSQQAHVLEAPAARATKGGAQGGRGILAPWLFTDPADWPPPPAASILGLRVRKRFGTHGTFVGTVSGHCPVNGYRVTYTDGDEEDLAAADLFALPLAEPSALVGRRLAKHFAGHGRFEGTVSGLDGGRGYAVTYDDGDAEYLAPTELLHLLLPESARRTKPRKRPRNVGGGAEA